MEFWKGRTMARAPNLSSPFDAQEISNLETVAAAARVFALFRLTFPTNLSILVLSTGLAWIATFLI
jgi:hypothetical protein